MQTEPIYKSVPTMRDYEEYKKAEQYNVMFVQKRLLNLLREKKS